MKFRAKSDKDRKIDINWDHIAKYVSRWKPETYFDVSITRRTARKSDPQRYYYCVAVLPGICEGAGYDPGPRPG